MWTEQLWWSGSFLLNKQRLAAASTGAAAKPNDFEGLQVGCYRGDFGAAASVAVIAAPPAAALAVWKLESEGEKCQRLWLLLKSFPLLWLLVASVAFYEKSFSSFVRSLRTYSLWSLLCFASTVVPQQLSQKAFEKLATNQDLSNAIEKVSKDDDVDFYGSSLLLPW